MKKQERVKPFMLLPAKQGTCPECAALHSPEEPHNRDSLFYQMKFQQMYGNWPTWKDAMRHCASEIKEAWEKELITRGIDISK